MRTLVHIVTTTLVLCCLGSQALAQNMPEQEPNDSCASAQQAGQAPFSGGIQGRLDPVADPARTDVDFFRFSKLSPGDDLAVSAGEAVGARVGLFDEQCKLLQSIVGDGNLRFNVPASGAFVVGIAERSDAEFAGRGDPSSLVSYQFFAFYSPNLGSIAGRVVDAVSGNPLAGRLAPFAGVRLDECFDPDGVDCRFVTAQQADASGQFRFETDERGSPLSVGLYRVVAFADDHQPATSGPFWVGWDEHAEIGDLALPRQPVCSPTSGRAAGGGAQPPSRTP